MKDFIHIGTANPIRDGRTDDALALREAIAVSQADGRPLHVSDGRYLCKSSIVIDAHCDIRFSSRAQVDYDGDAGTACFDVKANCDLRVRVKTRKAGAIDVKADGRVDQKRITKLEEL